ESHAVAGVRAEDDGILAFGVEVEHRLPVVAEQDRATPAARERKRAQRGVKAANALLERSEHLRGLCAGNVRLPDVLLIGRADQTCAPDDGIVAANAPPEIGQVRGVKRFSRAKAGGLKLLLRKRRCQSRERQAGMRALAEPAEPKGQRVRSQENFFCSDDAGVYAASSEFNSRARAPTDLTDRHVFENFRAACFRCAGETAHELPGI